VRLDPKFALSGVLSIVMRGLYHSESSPTVRSPEEHAAAETAIALHPLGEADGKGLPLRLA